MIAFDSSFLVDYLRGRDAARSFLERRDEPVYYVPTIVLFELYRDAAWADDSSIDVVSESLDWLEPLDFDADATLEAAHVHAELLANGTQINVADVMIAGVCRHHGASIVTSDGDFEAVDGLETIHYDR
ncbi:type II toxin-antitoxin system VapC family toxin [Natrarchaeobius chitinivorans]|uniref:Ribonuclease VapC n=1 Tax=Natrarchaeobius chitinivorans TaxID=1679083 RepID=A0A3N6P9E7_NATCH|nr:type II toxin-antitoxin system VapC family toxin [Natrarchaeobius chitinivorans]RQG95529.1 type II toxin-antitoxin system VapC family toxin [Natrarchaeobius chitinivorans]